MCFDRSNLWLEPYWKSCDENASSSVPHCLKSLAAGIIDSGWQCGQLQLFLLSQESEIFPRQRIILALWTHLVFVLPWRI